MMNFKRTKRGRPKSDQSGNNSSIYNKAIHLKISEEQKGKLIAVAKKNDLSVSQLLRRLINAEIATYDWKE